MRKYILTISLVCLAFMMVLGQEAKNEEQKKENLFFGVKEGANPDIYIDGKKYDYEIFELLDQSKIESVTVLKDAEAIKKYDAPNGVIIINTIKGTESTGMHIQIRERDLEKIKDKNETKEKPMIIIDGKESDHEQLSKMAPDAIQQIEVFKDGEAIKRYNAPQGVIVITTKKGKK